MGSELVIIDRHRGQLGNRLMFFASAYAFALADGRRLWFPTFDRYAPHFPALRASRFCDPDDTTTDPTPPDTLSSQRAGWVARRRLLARLRVLPGVVRKPHGLAAVALPPTPGGLTAADLPRRRLYMTGWRFFCPVGIHRERARILHALRLSDELERDADAFIAGLDPSVTWVAAHLRGTDYAGFLGGKHLHSLETYRAKLHEAQQALLAAASAAGPRRVGFVIFSDEPRDPSQFPGLRVVISGGSAMQDFARMSRLKRLVGPMSTFTAFAMYRAGGCAWHIGPHPDEDALGWVYVGYPIVRSAPALAEASGIIDRDGAWSPALDLAAINPRPSKTR